MTRYVVQYELEFNDDLSINDVVEIEANSEDEAMSKFDNDEALCEQILNDRDDSMCVTANAAWPA